MCGPAWRQVAAVHRGYFLNCLCLLQCGLEDDSLLAEMKRTFLTRGSVKADGEAPLFVSSGQRYSHVAAMRTQAADGREYTVLFLLTGDVETSLNVDVMNQPPEAAKPFN